MEILTSDPRIIAFLSIFLLTTKIEPNSPRELHASLQLANVVQNDRKEHLE